MMGNGRIRNKDKRQGGQRRKKWVLLWGKKEAGGGVGEYGILGEQWQETQGTKKSKKSKKSGEERHAMGKRMVTKVGRERDTDQRGGKEKLLRKQSMLNKGSKEWAPVEGMVALEKRIHIFLKGSQSEGSQQKTKDTMGVGPQGGEVL